MTHPLAPESMKSTEQQDAVRAFNELFA